MDKFEKANDNMQRKFQVAPAHIHGFFFSVTMELKRYFRLCAPVSRNYILSQA